MGVIDEVSVVLGKPTRSAQRALETRQVLLERAEAWECRKKAVKQREEALACRESDVLGRESVARLRGEMADRRMEIAQQTENELKQRIAELETLVEKERADKLMFMKARDQALERARAAEKLLGKDSGRDLSF